VSARIIVNFCNSSLAATIKLRRPDLLLEYNISDADSPVSEVPPKDFFKGLVRNDNCNIYLIACLVSEVPDVGELMTASFVVTSNIDPSKWYEL
jgi:hypothetical protein